MQADERIVNYMKARSEHAQTVAVAIAVQLFALAVFFCLYALMFSHMFYSLSENTGKVIMICISIIISVGLCVVNVMTAMRSKKVNITKPDAIALRDGDEVVRLAYSTARSVLIYKITYSLVICVTSGIVYIILLIAMSDQALAGIYGRIICCVAVAIATLIALPCVDRIACYRALLGQTHELLVSETPNTALKYAVAVCTPICICVWYILRYYGTGSDIAWVTFPFTALFAFAIVFLINWTKSANSPKES